MFLKGYHSLQLSHTPGHTEHPNRYDTRAGILPVENFNQLGVMPTADSCISMLGGVALGVNFLHQEA